MSNWRRQMVAAGVNAVEAIEELEIHLREEIEQRTRSGAGAQDAFESAVRRVGTASALGAEFGKIKATKRSKQMIRTMAILAALFGTVLGGSLVMPALGRWRDTGVLVLWPVLVGSLLAVIAACVVVYGVKKLRGTRGRNLISAFTIAAGVFYVVPLAQNFFFRRTELTGWIFCGVLAVASVLFYGTCLYLVRRSSATPIPEG